MWDRLQKDNAFYLACVFTRAKCFLRERCFLGVSQIINKQIYQNPLIFHSEMSTILLALKQKEC